MHGEDILTRHCEALFIGEAFFDVTPRTGEGVGGPETNRRDVDIHMLARAEGPWAGEFEGYAHGVAGEGFDCGFGATGAHVSVDDGHKTGGSLEFVSGWVVMDLGKARLTSAAQKVMATIK